MTADTHPPAVGDLLAAPITVAEPDVSAALTVFPLIAAAAPTLDYLAFDHARERGAEIRELPGGAEVGDLMVDNPLRVPVLLYEGQEVLGGQQDRTIEVSVLVPAHTSLPVPVSCIEELRWDEARHDRAFTPAPQAGHPQLRRLKHERVRARSGAGGPRLASQRAVWASVAATAARHGTASDTGALNDVFEGRRDELERTGAAIEVKCSQVGMLAAIGGRFVVLDYVSDVEAFAALHRPLVSGYALDALEAGVDALTSPSLDNARDFMAQLLATRPHTSAAVGLGEELRLGFGGLAGSGLAAEGELVTLTAFAGPVG
jgi:hypothetical protein